VTPRKAEFIAALSVGVARLIVATLRFRVEDRAGVLGRSDPRLIWLFWHNRLFVVPHLLNHFLPERSGGALTSASKDGEILAACLRRFRIRPVRGSSSRRGAAALIEMIRVIRSGVDMAITPDGPRGPRYKLNPGAITLAQKTGAKIMPIQVSYSRCWELRSWDRFQIPKPFARVDITLLPLETVAATETDAAFEAERARIEEILREGQE
jgi:lysophospholipid acyltransferase (LPLAT)-like uncharacterized protein